MESKILESKNIQKKSFNSFIEESEDSIENIRTSLRTRSHKKLVYSKITKKIRKQSPPKLAMSLNSYNSITMSSIPQKEKRETTCNSSNRINLINELNKTKKKNLQ